MFQKLARIFLFSAGVILTITGAAKVVSGFGSARVLQVPDPVFYISFQTLFWLVGVLEIVVASYCFFGKRILLKTGSVAWLASGFVLYRMALKWLDYQKPCSCLGSLTGALHIAPDKADLIMRIVLAYLFIGSYVILTWIWLHPEKPTPVAHATPASV